MRLRNFALGFFIGMFVLAVQVDRVFAQVFPDNAYLEISATNMLYDFLDDGTVNGSRTLFKYQDDNAIWRGRFGG